MRYPQIVCVMNLKRPQRRSGFTLVELLVVMLIIGILMALLIPAVNATRESARATQSRNNLKQITLAMHNFNSAKGFYPPNYLAPEYNQTNPSDASQQYYPGYASLEGWSVHTLLLPYLEQKLIVDEIDFNKPYNHYVQDASAADQPAGAAGPPTFTLADGTVVRLGTLRVPAYVSPAEPRDEVREGKHYPVNYAMNLGTWFVWDPLTGQGGNGAAFPNSKLRDGAFTDGLSTTLAFSEVKAWQPYFRDSNQSAASLGAIPPATPTALAGLIGTPGEYKETGHTEWFNGHAHHAGFTTVFRPNSKVMIANRTSSSVATVNTSATGNADVDWTNKQEGKNHFAATPATSPTYAAITARSYFPGSVNVAMMDGSVRSIENNINIGVWRAISTRASKEKLPNSFGQ
jgi:prepilin-type N-terminal cleavage/methylation domain-containing protein